MLVGIKYKKQFEELVSAFYGNKEITYIDENYTIPEKHSYIKSTVIKLKHHYEISTIVEINGVFVLENEIKWDTSSILSLSLEYKKSIYLALQSLTNKKLPWGILTGIRPAKLAHELMSKYGNLNSVSSILQKDYFVSDEKIHLLTETINNQKLTFSKIDTKMLSLYIGIPFCNSRCLYCSFPSNSVEKHKSTIPKYLDFLKAELTEIQSQLSKKNLLLQSIYIGGGTPTSLDEESLSSLLDFIENLFDLSKLEEYTLEAGRPDSINKSKLASIKNSSVTRISINPQSMDDKVLANIGRNHTSADIIDTFNLARELGFNNINMDLIVGLPGDTIETFTNTLEKLKILKPDSITIHCMALKKGSKLFGENSANKLPPIKSVEHMLTLATKYCKEMNLSPYYLYRQKYIAGNLENIGFSKKGMESFYNIIMMEEVQNVIGAGAGSITRSVDSHGNVTRKFNFKGLNEYLNRFDEIIKLKEID
jgi:coproporphyrinogen dehydrogenase HemZ